MNRHDAAACATQSPALRIFAPTADKAPPYKSKELVKSIKSSPDLARAFPESMSGSAAGFNDMDRDDEYDEYDDDDGNGNGSDDCGDLDIDDIDTL